MNIEIEDIKSLEPGKIYWITISRSRLLEDPESLGEMIENLKKIGKDLSLNFIFSLDGTRPISVPEGIEIVQK